MEICHGITDLRSLRSLCSSRSLRSGVLSFEYFLHLAHSLVLSVLFYLSLSMSNVMSILLKDMRKAIIRFSFLSSLSPRLLSIHPLHYHSYFSRVKSNGSIIQLTRFRPGGDIWIDEIRCATEHMYVCMYAPSPSESHNPYMPIYTYTIPIP